MLRRYEWDIPLLQAGLLQTDIPRKSKVLYVPTYSTFFSVTQFQQLDGIMKDIGDAGDEATFLNLKIASPWVLN
jgi:hypothetical protein